MKAREVWYQHKAQDMYNLYAAIKGCLKYPTRLEEHLFIVNKLGTRLLTVLFALVAVIEDNFMPVLAAR